MCMSAPKIPKDNSAELARQREVERAGRVTAGRAAIDEQFMPFNDGYFSGIEKSYNDYYQPQLTDQFNDARRGAILSLANSGQLNASSGARKLGDLTENYQKNMALLGDRGISSGNKARADVERNKSELYAQNRSAADPSAASSSALARAGTLQAAPSYDPLGNVFADFISNLGTGVAAERAGYKGLGLGLFNNKSGSGSSRVIS